MAEGHGEKTRAGGKKRKERRQQGKKRWLRKEPPHYEDWTVEDSFFVYKEAL